MECNTNMEREWISLKRFMMENDFNNKEIHNCYCAFRIGWVKGECNILISNIMKEFSKENK